MSNTTPAIDINQSGVPFFRVIKNPGAGEGQLTVWAQDSTRVPARIIGAASQSANLQEWRSSTGSTLASITASGRLSIAGEQLYQFTPGVLKTDSLFSAVSAQIDGQLRVGTAAGSLPGLLHVSTNTAASIGVVVRGVAAQTANLQEWQDSTGSVLSSVGTNGGLRIGSTGSVGTVEKLRVNTPTTIDNTASAIISTGGTTNKGLVIQAVASQQNSAYPLQIQDSTGSELFHVGVSDLVFSANGGNHFFGSQTSSWSGSGGQASARQDSGSAWLRLFGAAQYGWSVQSQAGTGDFVLSGGGNFMQTGDEFERLRFVKRNELRVKAYRTTATVTNKALTTNVATITTSTAHGLLAGMIVVVSGVDATFNGTYTVASVPTATTFTYALVAANVASQASGGSTVGYQTQTNSLFDLYEGTAGSVVASFTNAGTLKLNSAGTPGTVEKLRVNTPVTVDNLANAIITTSATTSKGLVIQASASQTANLQEWQDSAGTVLTSINANGALSIGSAPALTAGAIRLGNNSFITARNVANNGDKYLLSLDTGDNVVVGGSNSSRIYLVNAPGSGISIDTVASATGPGRGIYQGATSMGLFHYNGSISLTPGTASSFATVLTAARSSTNITIQTAATTDVGLAVRGVALQSANLQEWQNSAGTAVASVTSAGLIQANNGISTSAGNLNLNANGTYITIPSTKILTDDSLGNFIRLYVASAMEINGYRGVKISSRLSSSTDVLFVDATGLTTGKGLIVRSGASQTGNLTDWQNSAGVSLAYVTSGGDFNVNHDGNNTLTIQSSNSGSANIQLGASGTGPKLTYDPVVGALQISTGVTERLRVTNAGAVEINSTGTAGTVEKLRVNTPTTVDNLAATILSTGATTSKGLVIQGAAAQTANLFEIQDSTAAVIGGWNSNGTILYMGSSSVAIRSNSGNLITSDWNSIHARSLRMPSGYTSAALQSTSGVSMLVWDTVTTNPAILVTNLAATQKALVVRGYASQTANLQEWQDDAGTAIAYISAGGVLGASNSSLNVGYAGKGYRSLSVTQATRAADNDSYAVATFNATGTGDTYQNIGFNATMTGFNFSGSYGMTVRHSYTTTSAQFRVDGTKFGAGTASISTAPLGQVEIATASASRKALVVQGAASQTADLLQWQNDSGTVLSGVTANGELFTGTTAGISNTQLAAVARTATNVATVARGASSQTADLNQWQDNTGAVLGGVTSAGDLYTGTAAALANTQLSVVSRAAGNVGAIVRGATSQTASLQEWQSDAGVVLASVSAAGDLTVVDATVNGTLTVNGDTTINGHIITGNSSGTTTVAAGAGAGAGAGVSISGNDTTGKITVTTGTGSTAGVMATVTFANAFANAPRVTLTPSNGNGASIQYFAGASGTTTFTIDSNNAPTDTTTYEYYYQIME